MLVHMPMPPVTLRVSLKDARRNRLARAVGIVAFAGLLGLPAAAGAVGRTEPAAQMREQPIRAQDLRRQLLEHYGLVRGAATPLAPADPATTAPGLAPSIAPTIPPEPAPSNTPAIESTIEAVIDPSAPTPLLPVAPAGPLVDPTPPRPGGTPLVDRPEPTPIAPSVAVPIASPVASPIASPVAPPVAGPQLTPVEDPVGRKVRLSKDERMLLREQLRQWPRSGASFQP